MILCVLAALAGAAAAPADSLPRITLAEALARAARLDPGYVGALGAVDNAAWARRAARSAFVLPSITLSTDYTGFSIPQFNVGIGSPARTSATARIDARFELFTGFRKLAEVGRTSADLESARAGEVRQRFESALGTEADYYSVLSGRELLDVARDRVRRAEEQLVVARARVVSGAAVQSDSLQLLLELNRARVGLLQNEARLRVAHLQLGRRVGTPGGADAVPLDTAPAPPLPLTLPNAIAQALQQGPEYRVARANERSAEASVRARRSTYLPQAFLAANSTTFGDHFYPHGLTRTSMTVSVSFPLWDNAQRELAVSRARAARDAARAIREDLERAAEVDVTEAYEAYETARATADYSTQGLLIALENFRVQEARYRGGATTILDLLDAQTGLTEAQAELVQARYAVRLALAGLEAILGQRLFSDRTAP
ncbi:MAG TPA: TolC family protein [Gemmatimonadales bacterium]|jgi:outer membrane protein TolC|nr:TolC family protein [Gemmatimonadales bacterium]